MSELAISALLRKKSEILGEIEQANERLSTLHQQLQHIDGSLSVFGYEHAVPIRPTYKRQQGYFQQGELVRFIFDYLRQHGPQTRAELLQAVLAHKGLTDTDRRTRTHTDNKVRRALERQQVRVTVRCEGRPHGDLWMLLRPDC